MGRYVKEDNKNITRFENFQFFLKEEFVQKNVFDLSTIYKKDLLYNDKEMFIEEQLNEITIKKSGYARFKETMENQKLKITLNNFYKTDFQISYKEKNA